MTNALEPLHELGVDCQLIGRTSHPAIFEDCLSAKELGINRKRMVSLMNDQWVDSIERVLVAQCWCTSNKLR